MSFWQSLVGNIFGGRVATGDHPVPLVGASPLVGAAGGNQNPLPYTTATTNTPASGTANIAWDTDRRALTVTDNYTFYIEPGANIQIQPGALGGEATIRTHYDQNNMDRVFVFDNDGGTADNRIAAWNNGTTTASIQNLRIHEHEWRLQQTARQAGQYIQGRINDHLNQHIDNLGQQLQGQPQQRFNIDQAFRVQQAEIYRPFGGGLRHPEPPNLDTPRAIAEIRGNNLLKSIIGDVLYHHYEKKGYVDLPSVQKPGIGFRIRAHRRIGLLKRNRQGQWIEQKESLCIHAAGGYWVEGDQVGIHYMLCQCDEVKLWKQAVLHRVAA